MWACEDSFQKRWVHSWIPVCPLTCLPLWSTCKLMVKNTDPGLDFELDSWHMSCVWHRQLGADHQEAECNFLVIWDSLSQSMLRAVLYYWWKNWIIERNSVESSVPLRHLTHWEAFHCPFALTVLTISIELSKMVGMKKQADEWYLVSRPFLPAQEPFHPISLPVFL